ncbi:uncharacterized protein PGTG_17351 [Puccinia graminis f. sp. tritici CRL 75-36-700-3]|uniref:Uncharacterized protein n=1 Tax=Puccinia graminis f. sp. tritici (strain CRL 75-36-700-3 / race SCCL) TaxID=418459 RepID=E3L4C0_PUCGT|nr:uncharacterized protein PGTG_17351 [Puccinia graminis f. sp. tritici CRL 75-36-700-3]EFP91395.1 hypothetical protein PGTG_17351 [Puccinia graminis f. sp. tritici CRL 75-36-700-3]
MHPRRRIVEILVLCCLLTARHMAQVAPCQLKHARVGEDMTGSTSSQTRLSNRESLDLLPQISDIPAERDEEKTRRQFGTSVQALQNRQEATMKEDFKNLHRQLQIFTEAAKGVYKEKNIPDLLDSVVKLVRIYNRIPTFKHDQVLKWEDKILVLLPQKPNDLYRIDEPPTEIRPQDDIYQGKEVPLKIPGTTRQGFEVLNPSGRPLGKNLGLNQLPSGMLEGEDLDQAMEGINWAWLKNMNDLLVDIMSIKEAVRILKTNQGNYAALNIQEFVFRTVDFCYQHGLIELDYVKSFLARGDTLEFADFAIKRGIKVRSHLYKTGFDGVGCLNSHPYCNNFVQLVDDGIKQKYSHVENWMDDKRYSL